MGEHFAAFEFGRTAGWPEDPQPSLGEFLTYAQDQGQLRSDDGQIDRLVRSEVGQPLNLVSANRYHFGNSGDAGVARRTVELGDFGTLSELPADRVLSATATYDEYFHVLTPCDRMSPIAAASRVVAARTSRMSCAEQPRERSLTGCAKPCNSGPRARAPAKRSVSL